MKEDKVYFYCVSPESASKAAYHHLAICLAEGLKELGVKFYANINYWRTDANTEQFLFNHDANVTPDDCSIVVVSLAWFLRGKPFPQHLFHSQRQYYTVYLDREDGCKTYALQPEFRQFDLILKTHYCEQHWYPANVKPWAFGLSQRIINELKTVANFSDRNQKLLVNFRNKRSTHTVRKKIYRDFLPAIAPVLPVEEATEALNIPPADSLEYLWWYQTGKRHYHSYYQRLQSTAACAGFGGYFVTAFPRNKGNYFSYLQKRILGDYLGLSLSQIIQWDSWRLWESMAAGCATFHVDFKQYGMVAPVMPQNWQHYIGINLNNIEETVERIKNQPDILEKVAIAGREWVLKNYSPLPTAQRFLAMVNNSD